MTVNVGLADDGTIEYLAIDTPDETPGIGTNVSEDSAFLGQFIGKSGPFTFGEDGIEALAGATVTSQAALDALNSLYEGGAAEEEERHEAL